MSYFIPLGLLFICFLALGAGSLKSFSRHRLEVFCTSRRSEKLLADILKHYDQAASAVNTAQIIAVILFTAVVIYACPLPESAAARCAAAGLGIAALLFAEFWLPRALANIWGTYIVYYAWSLWSLIGLIFLPLTFIDRLITVFFRRLAGHADDNNDEETFGKEIRTIVTEGHREGLLEGDAREMIEGVIELQDVSVSEVMTPRTDMKSISVSLSWDEMLKYVMSVSHSRIPVYKETRDDIIGVLHIKNLLRELAQPDPASRRHWTELLSEPLFVPETKPVDTLLQEFQNTRRAAGSDSNSRNNLETDDRAKGHLAIVLDEYGGVSGIVTLEDILEEIVGEIKDEHDTLITIAEITEINPGTFEVLGKTRIDDVNSQLGLHLPDEEDYDTVAGFIFSTLGHVPEAGEFLEFEYDGSKCRLTVVAASRRRIEKIRIERE